MKKIFFALVLFVSSLTFSQVSAVKHGFSTNFYGLTSSGSNIYVGGSLDLFRSSDDGATWDSTLIVESTFGQIPGINNVEGIMMDSTGTGFMVGFTNLGNPYSVFKTVNNGNTWDIVFQESGNLPSYLKDIIKASNGDLYTCGTYGKMFKSSDGGSNWESINIYGSDECNEMVFSAADSLFVARKGRISRYIGSSNNVSTMLWSNDELISIDFPSSAIGYAIATNGSLYKSVNSGTSWDTTENKVAHSGWPKKISFLNDTVGFLLTSNYLLKTENGGQDWERLFISNIELNDIHFVNSSTAYITGERNQLYKVSNIQTMGFAPMPKFSASTALFCRDSTVVLTNQSPDHLNYTFRWLYNGKEFAASRDASFTVGKANQSDTISLIATNAFYSDTSSLVINVEDSVEIDFSPYIVADSLCEGEFIFVGIHDVNYAAYYSLIDSGNVISTRKGYNNFKFNGVRTYASRDFQVKGQKTVHGCGTSEVIKSVSTTIKSINEGIQVNINKDQICAFDTVKIQIPSPQKEHLYVLEDGSQAIDTARLMDGKLYFKDLVVSESKNLQIRAIGPSGCEEILNTTISINVEKVKSKFSVTEQFAYEGKEIEIEHTSFNPNVSYTWHYFDVNGAKKSTTLKPSKLSYNSAGKFPLTLISITPAGCKDTAIKDIKIISKPTADCFTSMWSVNDLNTSWESMTVDQKKNTFVATRTGLHKTTVQSFDNFRDTLSITFNDERSADELLCVTKYNDIGQPAWMIFVKERSTFNNMSRMTTDKDGNLYIIKDHHFARGDKTDVISADGSVYEFEEEGPMPFRHQEYFYVMKFNKFGVFQWQREFHEYSHPQKFDIHTTDQYLYWSSPSYFGKMDFDGNLLWDGKSNSYNVAGNAFDVSTDGDIFMARGWLQVMRHDSSKNFISFSPQLYNSKSFDASSLNIDDGKNSYVATTFSGSFTFNNQTFSSSGGASQDLIISKVNAEGNHVWVKLFKSSGYLHVSANGFQLFNNKIYLMTQHAGSVSVSGAGNFSGGSSGSTYFWELDTAGNILSQHEISGTSSSLPSTFLGSLQSTDGLHIDDDNVVRTVTADWPLNNVTADALVGVASNDNYKILVWDKGCFRGSGTVSNERVLNDEESLSVFQRGGYLFVNSNVELTSLRVINSSGEEVHFSSLNGVNEYSIESDSWPTGMYIIIGAGEELSRTKVLVVKQ